MSDAPKVVASLEVIEQEVIRQRSEQLEHLQALDSKAGIVLGFAAAIATLLPGGEGTASEIGRLLAMVAGLMGLSAMWPRTLAGVDPRRLHDYLPSEPSFTRLLIVDTVSRIVQEDQRVGRNKVRRLRIAWSILVSAAVVSGLEVVLGVRGG